MAPFGHLLNVMLDDLIGRDVDHVVLNCQIGASCVDIQTLLVVDKDDFWQKFVLQLSSYSFN